MKVRTRFAPSPTGYLHIGGVRTALFNWLLARRYNGQFILRIDDTDSERNRTEALQPILDGFRWLGIQWDEGPDVDGPFVPYYQSQRNDTYIAAAKKLIETGWAYPDYLSKEQLDAERAKAQTEKKPYVHRGPLRDEDAAECLRMYEEKPTTVRFRVPEGRKSIINDLICGQVEMLTDLIGDPVILRPDGRALYNFASVVDDAAFEITHVIRAREHLTNTYTQVLIFEALGYPMPAFGHVPVVNAPNSKEKLSKRKMAQFMTPEIIRKLKYARAVDPQLSDDEVKTLENLNPATVEFYRAMGYLPEAVVNYLARLGWSLDDKTEIISIPEMIANFSLERVNDSPASFDPNKFYWVAGEYMKNLPLDKKVEGCIPFLLKAGWVSDPIPAEVKTVIERIVQASGDRIKLFSDVLVFAGPILQDNFEFDPKAVEKRLKKAGIKEILQAVQTKLVTQADWTAASLDKILHELMTETNSKPGDVTAAIRVAITGVEVGFSLFDTMELVGRERFQTRIQQAIALI